MAKPRSSTIQEALPEPEETKTGEEPQDGARVQERPKERSTRAPLSLPTERSAPSGSLLDKTVLIYGPPKIGKSTLANEFGDILFADTEGGLSELAVFSKSVPDWQTFLEVCAAYAESDRFTGMSIDTLDMLSIYCSAYTNAKLGIVHESDLEWGKGWNVKRDEMVRALAKLAAIPGRGLILVSHSKQVEIKLRNRTITKSVPDLTGAARDVAIDMADLILFADHEGEGEEERRVLRTKPSAYWEAGERGKNPRLPETIDLSFDALAKAWEEGGKNA